jgi:hypothetical protein
LRKRSGLSGKMRTKEELELCKENVAIGEPLDMPLRVLNQSCKFRNVWDKFAGKETRRKSF